jgi:hypothetical protein
MGWFDFFRKLKPVLSAELPRAVVQFDAEAVTCTRPSGLTERVRWQDLRAVLIQTTSDGPGVDDFFWILVGEGAKSGCVVPSESVGCDSLLARLQELPGFDNEAVIRASQCLEDQRFLCWKREPDA